MGLSCHEIVSVSAMGRRVVRWSGQAMPDQAQFKFKIEISRRVRIRVGEVEEKRFIWSVRLTE